MTLRTTILLLCFIVALTCSVFADVREASIVIRGNNPARTDLIPRMISAFEEAYPDYSIQPIMGREPEVLTMYAAGDPPVWYHLGAETFESWVSQGILTPIDHFLEKDGIDLREYFIEAAVDSVLSRGATYAIPANLNANPFFYNKDLFAQAGLVDPPVVADESWTWETYRDVLKKLTRDISGDGIPDIVGMEYRGNDYTTLIYNGQWVDKEPMSFTSDLEPIRSAIEYWHMLMHVDGSVAMPMNSSRYQFDQGTAAIRWDHTGRIAVYDGVLPFDWEIAPTPYGAPHLINMNTLKFVYGAANDDVGYEFAKFIQMNDDWATEFAEAFGGVPSLQSAIQPYLRDRMTPRQTEVIMGLITDAVPRAVGIERYNDIQQVVHQFIRPVYNDEISIEEGIDLIRNGIENILSEIRR